MRYAIYVNGQEVENGTEPSTGGSIQGLPAGIHLYVVARSLSSYNAIANVLQMDSWFLATTWTDTVRTTRSQSGTNTGLRRCKAFPEQ